MEKGSQHYEHALVWRTSEPLGNGAAANTQKEMTSFKCYSSSKILDSKNLTRKSFLTEFWPVVLSSCVLAV